MSLSGSLGAIPATAVFRRRFTSAIGAHLRYYVKAYANAGFFRASNASGLELFRQPGNAKSNAFLSDRKIQVVEALQDTGRCCFGHSKFLDIDTTLGYPSRFLLRRLCRK